MKKIIFYIFFILFYLTEKNIKSQNYHEPIDFQILLSGTFGELRNNHFHSGIDIKTGGVEGKKIYSINDGYVSRIKVSPWGYGKALYITHPDGKTSVYAHLKKFSDKIQSIVKKEHYRKESFDIQLFPKPNSIMVNKGEVIAFSGNTGGSGGPHLHFEIRETKTERPINPLAFNFKIKDDINPIIKNLKIYNLENENENIILQTKKETKNRILEDAKETHKQIDYYSISSVPKINGNFSFGINAYDQSNNSKNKNGVYSIELHVNNNIIYHFKADKLDFSTTRYINAHMDFKEKIKNKIKFHRCYVLPNNKLDNYVEIINNGIITSKNDSVYNIKIKVSDYFQNLSILKFKVISNKTFSDRINLNTKNKFFNVSEANIYKTNNFKIHMPAYALYDTLNFKHSLSYSQNEKIGTIHHCQNNYTPLQKQSVISIKSTLPNKLKNKAYIAKRIKKNKFKYMGGKWIDKFISTKVKELGDFCVLVDTLPPEIKLINIYDEKNIYKQKTIECIIKDNESGIKNYRAEIDGKWILMEYDYKKNLLKYEINEKIQLGAHNLNVKVTDNLGNTETKNIRFRYNVED